jgi:hypothetical protein
MSVAAFLMSVAAFLLGENSGRGARQWTIALLIATLAIGIAYVAIGAQVREIAQNDGAYYFGVARHMARHGRFEEPIVWHFLHPPDSLTHAPFDYWGCLTTLLLVPALWLFGDTPRTAFVTMSLLSAAALLAFWYLVCIALPLRHRVTQLLSLLLFAFSPLMVEFRFQPREHHGRAPRDPAGGDRAGAPALRARGGRRGSPRSIGC